MTHFTFLPFHLFTWGCSEVQIQNSRRLILPFYIITFLPGGALRSRFRPQDGSFNLFNFSPFYHGVLWGLDSSLKTAHFTSLSFYLLTWGQCFFFSVTLFCTRNKSGLKMPVKLKKVPLTRQKFQKRGKVLVTKYQTRARKQEKCPWKFRKQNILRARKSVTGKKKTLPKGAPRWESQKTGFLTPPFTLVNLKICSRGQI